VIDFWPASYITNSKLASSVAHKVAQVADIEARFFTYTDEQRCRDGHPMMTNLADDCLGDFKLAR
jgi:hypothetical protein